MIWAALSAVMHQHSEKLAIISNQDRWTYRDLLNEIERVARLIPCLDGTAPMRVVLAEEDNLKLIVQVLACWKLGLVPCIARESRSSEAIHDIAKRLEPSVIWNDDWPFQQGRPDRLRNMQARDEGLVMCTSGSTGDPKLVALPAEAMTITSKTIAQDLGFRSEDIIAVATPVTYMYGLIGGSVSGLMAGATLRMFSGGMLPSEIQSAIREDEISVFQAPPSYLRLFLKYWNGTPFEKVRMLTTGGETIDAGFLPEIRKAFPSSRIHLLYGMTEAGPRISHSDCGYSDDGTDRKWKPFEHFDWFIEPVSDGNLPPGAGRLVLRGPTVFLGYISQCGGYSGLDDLGYFRSSDAVVKVGDNAIDFVGRIDRMFKSGGKLVNPSEVEAVLKMHAKVEEAHCRTDAHAILGLVPVADVQLTETSDDIFEALQAHCLLHLQRHAVPRKINARDTFHLGKSGKLNFAG